MFSFSREEWSRAISATPPSGAGLIGEGVESPLLLEPLGEAPFQSRQRLGQRVRSLPQIGRASR
jgi:hypothetical protein